jgi:sugar (pentulose or hexulose) kinase
MKNARNYLAFDLGASSGRAILGRFDGGKLSLEEKHRFVNGPVQMNGRLYWNVLGMFEELRAGLAKCGGELSSFGIDTWGVDYGIVGAGNALMSLPVHYRDARTDGMMELADRLAGNARIYGETGIALMKFNTLYQLLAAVRTDGLPPGGKLLFMPDLLSWMLTGETGCEYTIASTSGLVDARNRSWDLGLMRALGLPEDLFLPIEPAGTVRGELSPDVRESVGLGAVKAVAVGEHDTASAVAAVPAAGETYAYLSSGTWSLMGFLSETPVIGAESLAWNYTNEGGADGKYRVLKNIMGLWILQECLREWRHEKPGLNFTELVDLAEKEKPFLCFIDPDDGAFFEPGPMALRVGEYCLKTGQRAPGSVGAVVRCVLESLALKYRWAMGCGARLSGGMPEALHIVGGGSQNRMLNRFTANALGMPVVCGPVEATAIGNLLVQAKALGDVASFAEIREVVRASFDVTEVLPESGAQWDEAYGRFLKITGLEDANE